MKINGFSLIELLVYAALSMFMVVLVMRFFSFFALMACKNSKQAVFETSCNAGLDVLVRDCAAAPADVRRWLFMQSDLIAWKRPFGIEGFSLQNGKLIKMYRAIGDNGLLQNPAYSTLLQYVQGNFSINQSRGFVISIHISLKTNFNNQTRSIDRLVYLKEGLV